MVVLLPLGQASAQNKDEILISGKGEGTYCGLDDGGDYVYGCVVQRNAKRYMMVSNSLMTTLEKMKPGTPVIFEFDVMRTNIEEAGEDMTIVLLTSIKAK